MLKKKKNNGVGKMTEKLTTGEEIAVIKNDLKYIKTSIDVQSSKLDKFIDSVDKKYATKEQLVEVRQEIQQHTNNSKEWTRWIFPVAISAINLILAIIVMAKGGI